MQVALNVMKLRPELTEESEIFSAKLSVLFCSGAYQGPTRYCCFVGSELDS